MRKNYSFVSNRNVNFALPYGQPLKINFGSSDPEISVAIQLEINFLYLPPQIVNNSEIKFTSYLQ